MTEQVTDRQIIFVIFITIVGYSVIELPKTMAETAGTGAWITLMLSAIAFSIPACIFAYLGYLFQGKTLFEYSQILIGKPLSVFLSIIYFIYFLIILAFLNRSAAEVIKVNLLYKTPIGVTMFVMLLFSGYAASKGITNVGRILEYYGIIIIFLALFIHIAMASQGDLMNIRPFYESTEANNYITAIPDTVIAFLGFELLTVIPFSKSNGKRTIGYVFATMLTVGIFYAFVVETSFMVLSIEDTKNYVYALITAMRRVEIKQLQFLVRLDIIFFMAWLFAIFSTFTVVIYGVSSYLSNLFPSIKNLWVILIVVTLAYLLGMLPEDIGVIKQILSIATNKLGLFLAGVVPIILFAITKGKKYV